MAGSTEFDICASTHKFLKWMEYFFAQDIANKSGVMLTPLAASLSGIDTEVTYYRTDWKDPSINKRLRAIEKYEVLGSGLIDHIQKMTIAAIASADMKV